MSNAPKGPYTPVVRAGDWIIVSGQLGMKDGALVAGGVTAQTAQAVETPDAATVARIQEEALQRLHPESGPLQGLLLFVHVFSFHGHGFTLLIPTQCRDTSW